MVFYEKNIQVFQIPVPWLLGICFDCTVSIKEKDFKTMKQELINFLIGVHRRALLLQGLPSDFICLTAFKDREKIFGPSSPLNVVKMDQAGHVGALCHWIDTLKQDGKATAIYDAIVVASKELIDIDNCLPNNYLKIVIVITDGEDNDSQNKIDSLHYFGKTDLNLAVIGVGNSTKKELQKMSKYATLTLSISGFNELFRAITISVEKIVENIRRISL